jgi:hypothetical protein
VSSQTCDAASAMLIVSEAALKRYNLTPRARIHHMSVRADDPIWMLTAPIPATQRAKQSGMKLQDIDLVEINEAFASVAMAWLKDTGYPHERTNVNGGAIALGHPLGRHRHQADDHAAARTRAHRRPLRPADDVRRRWPGERDHHREAVRFGCSRAAALKRCLAPWCSRPATLKRGLAPADDAWSR